MPYGLAIWLRHMDGRPGGRADGQTGGGTGGQAADGRTDGRADGRTQGSAEKNLAFMREDLLIKYWLKNLSFL